jgi:hypothetical protein
MAYIGTPPSNAFTSLLKQDFSTSATTGYTLDHAVNNANDIALFINFVRQEPTAAYSASGTTLTLTSATASSDEMYCVYLGQALQTVNPPNASVGASQIVDASITSGKLASGVLPTNPPSFQVKKTSTHSISSASFTKLTWDAEDWDTDNAFASDKFTVPSGEAGKYYFQVTTEIGGIDDAEYVQVLFYKNGSSQAGTTARWYSPASGKDVRARTNVILNLAVNDYIEAYIYHNEGGSQNASNSESFFRGYKLIGV